MERLVRANLDVLRWPRCLQAALVVEALRCCVAEEFPLGLVADSGLAASQELDLVGAAAAIAGH